MKNTISFVNQEKAKDFLEALWKRINEYSLLNAPKNDINDYIIYLLDTHCKLDDQERFFSSLSNSELERLLQLNSTKIKSTKKNIAVKYMNDDEYEGLVDDFIGSIKNEKIKFKISKDNKLSFVIENPAIRAMLENKLKVLDGDTLEYTLNSEKVQIDIKSFLELLKSLNTNSKCDILDEIIDKINKDDLKGKAIEIIKNTLKNPSLLKGVTNITILMGELVKKIF